LDPVGLTRALKERAHALGFAAAAVARAGRLDRHAAALVAWLRTDRHATMAWMARSPERRADPSRLLPGCRSVAMFAMDYWPGEGRESCLPRRGRVAMYARARDYHKVLGRRLAAIATWLQEETGLPARSFVDTGPVLEKAWAERAGIGWIGKNANLLTIAHGSWLLLGEILSAAELEPDAGPHPDHCGSCTACLDACPTRAIVEPGVVDSNLCISYWTIEHRGPIPESRREGIGDWMFGCDVCQEVCPWNGPGGPARRIASAARAEEIDQHPLRFRDDLRDLDPMDLLSLSEAEFRGRFSGTPLMRAKWEGMRRNACIVLGNVRSREAVPVLRRALDDPDPTVRSHAAWALGRVGGKDPRGSREVDSPGKG
jgi:epoxyqueuosine reductase